MSVKELEILRDELKRLNSALEDRASSSKKRFRWAKEFCHVVKILQKELK